MAFPWLAAATVAAAGASAAGQAAANSNNSAENRKQRAFNRLEAKKSRDWQEMMSNTAFQRSRADMVKAGLNPLLMAGSPGASSPAGAAAAAGSGIPQESATGDVVSSALDTIRTKREVDEAESRIGLNKSQEDLNKENKQESDDRQKGIFYDTINKSKTSQILDEQLEQARQLTKETKAATALKLRQIQTAQDFYGLDETTKRVGAVGSAAGSFLGPLGRGIKSGVSKAIDWFSSSAKKKVPHDFLSIP